MFVFFVLFIVFNCLVFFNRIKLRVVVYKINVMVIKIIVIIIYMFSE